MSIATPLAAAADKVTLGSGKKKFLALEGLRGILALLVCIGHLGLNTMTAHVGVSVRFGLSVDVFFALSGFVLAYSSYFGRKDAGRFGIGRVARLYPLHLLTLLAMALLILLQGAGLDVPVLIENIFLVQNVGLPPYHWGFNFPSWSISVEIWISLLFFFLCRRASAKWALGALAVVLVLSLAVPGLPLHDQDNLLRVINFGLLRGIAGFSVGVAAFLLADNFAGISPRLLRWCGYGALVVMAALFCLPHWPFGANVVFYAAIFLALIALARTGDESWLAGPVFVWLGAISYAVYLLHIPIFTGLNTLFGDGVLRGLAKAPVLAAVLLTATLVHRLFEMPVQRWILRISGKPAAKVRARAA